MYKLKWQQLEVQLYPSRMNRGILQSGHSIGCWSLQRIGTNVMNNGCIAWNWMKYKQNAAQKSEWFCTVVYNNNSSVFNVGECACWLCSYFSLPTSCEFQTLSVGEIFICWNMRLPNSRFSHKQAFQWWPLDSSREVESWYRKSRKNLVTLSGSENSCGRRNSVNFSVTLHSEQGKVIIEHIFSCREE